MTVLERVPVDRITTEARQVEVGRTLATILAGFFYVIGWLAAKVFGLIWFALAWSATAVKVGWAEGRRPADRGPGT